ncbi:AAA family ATPase [Mesorhizobium sp. L-8-3]|uniref:AAA family ATPase n=1 Tax=Mesorhizobium sp. L-8-3 TaxID=2744522 RepID=UPI0019252BD2|nr:AAA family ATPase [Mesorhizobium sp. L-8-3]BCH23553.1 hypothetical protein MesoLjLb_33380 [Mesorhizobium sp. L-8-3]
MTEHRSPEDRLEDRNAILEHYGPGDTVPTDGKPVLPLPTVCAADLAVLPTPQRSFLDDAGLLPERNVTMLSGDGGSGKSLLAMQLAVAVAAGTYWLGTAVKRGGVLYVSAEDDLDETHIRLKEICSAEHMDLAQLTNLELCDLAGQEAVLASESGTAGEIKLTPLFGRLRLRMARSKPRLLVLDNLADIFSGNENSRPLARQFIGALRGLAIEFDCTVLLLSHPSLSGLTSGSGTSGSTAWNNSVRSRLYLVRDREQDGGESDANRRTLSTMKANYGPTGGTIPLRWEAGRFVRTDADDAGFLDTLSGTQKAERVFLELLRWHVEKNKPASPLKSPTYAPAIFARHPKSEGIQSRAFEVAMNRLLDQDRVRIVEEGPLSRIRRRLELVDHDSVEP